MDTRKRALEILQNLNDPDSLLSVIEKKIDICLSLNELSMKYYFLLKTKWTVEFIKRNNKKELSRESNMYYLIKALEIRGCDSIDKLKELKPNVSNLDYDSLLYYKIATEYYFRSYQLTEY
jgi:hypothetical protein